MFKKILRMATAFVALSAAYLGYSRGFALMAGRVATVGNVPILPMVAVQSKSSVEATELAEAGFGPGHWAVRAPMRYYDKARGYWIYYENQERLNDGKTWKFSPIAVITRDKDGKALKTITGRMATLEFSQPVDVSRPGGGSASVTHALIEGDVVIRDDKGTPDLADDLKIGPHESFDYDEVGEQITSVSRERLVLTERGLTASGVGLVMQLRRKPAADGPQAAPKPSAGGVGSGVEGVQTITLKRDVEIDIQDVGRSGIVPGGASTSGKATAEVTKDGKPVAKPGPRPGHIQCSGEMVIEMPTPRIPPKVGPPAPTDATIATFYQNVRVRQGDPQHPEQIDGDKLVATLVPAAKPDPARPADPGDPAAQAKSKAQSADLAAREPAKTDGEVVEPSDAGTLSNLALRRAVVTSLPGHVVWLQSEANGTVGRGNQIIYDRFLPARPDQIYFWGERDVEIVKTDRDAKGKPETINTIVTKDVTVFQYAAGGPAPSIVARGPGTLEARPAGKEEVERFASWRDRLVMHSLLDRPNRIIKLFGRPRVRSTTQGDISANEWIIAEMEPKPAKAKASAVVVEADGRPVPANAPAPEPADKGAAGDGMRIKQFRALGDVHLVTIPSPADPKANPPKAASPGREITARKTFLADFADAPEPAAPATKPEPPAASTTAAAPSPAPAANNSEAVAQAAPAAPKPPAKPEEPAMTAIADDVWALVAQQAGTNKGEVQEAKLTGDVVVHQEASEGQSQGSDLTARLVFLKNKGENRAELQAIGTIAEPARAVTEARTIIGPVLNLDQAADHAWVKGAGRLEMEQAESDFLDDTAAQRADPAKAKDAAARARKPKKGPLIITWGDAPEDKTAWMHFYGQPRGRDGRANPAQAVFFSHVRARTDDSSLACEKLTAFFDAPIPFVRPRRDPSDAKPKEKEPGPQISYLDCVKDVEIIARTVDPDTGYLKDKKRILNPIEVTYNKRTGQFNVPKGPGEVFLYSTKARDDPAKAKAPMAASDRRSVRPVSARVEARKAQAPEISLTHVRFKKTMAGRFAPPKDAKPGEYSEAEFLGNVESVMAKVADETVEFDVDNLPEGFYRLVSDRLKVQVEPPPSKAVDASGKKEPDRVLLDAWGAPRGATAQTQQQVIKGDRITYDSLNELTYVYGDKGRVDILTQDGPGQPFTSGRGRALVYNHRTGQSELIDPQTFQVINPGGERSAASPLDVPKVGRNVSGLQAPARVDPRGDASTDLMLKARQLRLPPRSDKERRGFYGR